VGVFGLRKRLTVLLSAVFAAALALLAPAAAFAHGVKIEYRPVPAVEITAAFDSGEPMAGAQVAVFSPGDPAVPWLTGTCDDRGRFVFSPDGAQLGSWSVQVRQAGHGGTVHITVGEAGKTGGAGAGFSTLQLVLMGACVLWGLFGTALYFSRKKGT